MILLFAANVAHAQQDASLCKGGFTEQDLQVRLSSAETSLATAETEVARRLVEKARDQLVCLEHVIQAEDLSKLGYELAALAYEDQDETAALRWARMARQAAPEADWPSFIPEGDPLRDLVETEGPPSPSAGAGRLLPPKGGGVFVDGAFVDEVSGYAEVPAFFQVADVTGRVIDAEWVESDAWPSTFVGPPGPPPPRPKWWTDQGFDPTKTRKAPEDRPPVVPIAATTGLAVVSGALYALAASSAASLHDATTEDELAGARARTNSLVVGSMAAAAGALGAGVTVVLASDGGAGLGFHARF